MIRGKSTQQPSCCERELAHLRHRAYRGVETVAPVKGSEVHGTFTYRGRTYTK